MGCCPVALFHALALDLSPELPTLTFRQMYDASDGRAIAFWPGITSREFKSVALLNSFTKKFQEGGTEANANAAALQLFLDSNKSCDEWYAAPFTHDIDAIVIGHFEDAIYRALGPDSWIAPMLNLDSAFLLGGVGKGSAVKANGTSFYMKMFGSRLTTTRTKIYAHWATRTSCFPSLRSAESFRVKTFGRFLKVQGSSLAFAAKNSHISRVTCTEASLNMFYQKGIGAMLEQVLRRSFGIDLTLQPDNNRELARIGSITGEFGTADWSSMSDLISLTMIRRFIPAKLLGLLELTRSEFTRLPDGTQVPLHMVSSMGNGFTFPLMTLLLCCLVQAVYEALDIKLERPTAKGPGNFAVFGDDVVVDRKAYDLLLRMSQWLGFRPNRDKSFNLGAFRESCGSDWLAGEQVRGIYMKHLRAPQKRYSLYNRLVRWSCNTGVSLPHTLNMLRGSAYPVLVPPYENEDAGFHVSWDEILASSSLKEVEDNVGWMPTTGSVTYKAYRPYAAQTINVSNVQSRKLRITRRGREFEYPFNHSGILVCAAAGTLRDGNIGERQDAPRYSLITAVAPCWDYCGEPSRHNFTRDGWTRFTWLSFLDS